ncbi:MAG: hypothetical protein ACD_4C00356G0004 [uncultured bacterium (gcode 4)]|uniref:Uncharacterized protein n=1 Tax=uncultured bacterium (gcode 4) TaxID=1234023 RepID=K2FTM0_9BACT|nr:MAG: hypothetical protein ACD_4C00356G0004 [uncultured bacterium (gcode 4)]
MTNFDITKYSKAELQDISKILKKYKNLKKNIGKKSSEIMHYELSWDHKVVIEFFPTIIKENVLDVARNIYINVFWIEIDENILVWKPNSNLQGWIRLFFGDDMLDVSFESVSNNLRKI